jgi:outer membrane protein
LATIVTAEVHALFFLTPSSSTPEASGTPEGVPYARGVSRQFFRRRFVSTIGIVALLLTGAVAAQETIALKQAVERALSGYPGIAAAAAERDVATATIRIARQAFLPRIDGLLQLNRATHNNVSGLLFPQSTIAPISGPPALDNSATAVWGTAVGALVSWEPFDFGARRSAVSAAQYGDERARVTLERTRLDTAAVVADAYLSVLASREAVKAAQAAVTRADVLVQTVEALVGAELRPGVDASSARAEQAAARMQTTQAQRTLDAALALLAQYVGTPAQPVPLPTIAPLSADGVSGPSPILLERQAALDEATARLDLARRSADPRLLLQGTAYGRGTGVLDDNSSGSGADGLGLDAYNWGVGLTVTVPLLEWGNKRAREAAEMGRVEAATARREETARDLARREAQADAELRAASELARQVPVVVQAASAAHEQSVARYQSGLSSITDVADAQRRLAQADIDAGLADLAVWRARLARLALTAPTAEAFVNALPGRP